MNNVLQLTCVNKLYNDGSYLHLSTLLNTFRGFLYLQNNISAKKTFNLIYTERSTKLLKIVYNTMISYLVA